MVPTATRDGGASSTQPRLTSAVVAPDSAFARHPRTACKEVVFLNEIAVQSAGGPPRDAQVFLLL